MKKRKSIGFRWIGNRTVIGSVCMIAAIGICFGIAPTVQKLSAGKTTILRVTRTVPRGSCLTEADVETVEVGSYGLSRDILRDKTAAVGKYATTDLYAGEYLIPAKLTANGADANGILESLTVGKKAISVTLGSFAQGLSGKLETGDTCRSSFTAQKREPPSPRRNYSICASSLPRPRRAWIRRISPIPHSP